MRALLLAIVIAAVPSVARAVPHGDDGDALVRAAQDLDALRLEEAAPVLDELAARYPDDPDVRFERGTLRLLRGDYEAARADLEATLVRAVGLRSPETRSMLAQIAHDTAEVTHGFLELRSSDGRYIVRYAPGPDRFLAPDALDVMRAVDEGLAAELGYRHPGPLRLEILPTASALSRVSALTIENIELTGTIALCKWDRLMITSPRALVHGYPWADTIGHETVHLVLARMTEDRAPVWMQEGYARFLERRWRGGPPHVRLDAGSSALLVRRASEGTLIPFEQLHPSIAMLPSAEDAALAFAQVSTFVDTFYADHGREALIDVASRVRRGQDAQDAFAEAGGVTFEDLVVRWHSAMDSLPVPEVEAEVPHIELRHGDAEPDDSDEVHEAEARRFVRLGDLLWTQQHPLAASVEYGRAHAISPDDPVVASRLARAAVRGGNGQAAIDALAPLRDQYDDHAPLLATLGAAYALVGDQDAAREASTEAIRVNPFDPEPHCTLASLDGPDTAREHDACVGLGSASH
jgi:tetratricopeptide (TPR) repeat protein